MTAHPVSIFDAGAILAAPGGTAIEFAGSGNTLTLGTEAPAFDWQPGLLPLPLGTAICDQHHVVRTSPY